MRRRTSIIDGLLPDVVLCPQDILHTNKKYVEQLKSAYEFAKGQFPSDKIITNENVRPIDKHNGRYNAPTTHDVAILMPNDPVGNRDIVLHIRPNQLQRINELHKSYDTCSIRLSCHMVVGSDGWSLQLKLRHQHKVTQLNTTAFIFSLALEILCYSLAVYFSSL